MSRIDQINELLREKIAIIIEREIEISDALITIAYVDCSHDLASAKVGFSVLPDNKLGTTFDKLKKNSGNIAKILNKEIKLRKIPKLNWVFDSTEKNASELDKVFEKIEKGEAVENEKDINFE